MSTITTLLGSWFPSNDRVTINNNFTALNNWKAEISWQTFTWDISVPDEVYWVGWDWSLEVPTKNAVYDKIQTISTWAPTTATYITQTPDAGLSNEQALSALATGLVKNTTGTGVLTIWAQGTDYYAPGGTDVAVTDWGTWRSTGTTAYSLIATGTTATWAQQTLANWATTEILVWGWASALPVWTTATWSWAPVRATSPTLVTPALWTPTALVGTNITGTGTGFTSWITNALKSASTTVDVSAATAPSSGQVLTATSSTTATWQTSSWGITRDMWYGLTGTFATTSTFTTTEASSAEATRLAWLSERSLFTCTDTTGATRRIGYIKSTSTSTVTITYTVVTDTDLASGDKDFKITPNRKVDDYVHRIQVPGEVVADASNPQWAPLLNVKRDSYLLPVNSAVVTAAAWAWAACSWNVYKWATNLFSSAQDMTTNATFDEKRPNTNTISAADNITLRLTSSAGATNKASTFQAELFVVPQLTYTSI